MSSVSDILYCGIQQFQESARPSSHEILYGYKPNKSKFYVPSHFLLIAKQHVYVSTLSNKLPSLSTFKVAFRHKLQIEKQVAVQNNELVEFGRKWDVLFPFVFPFFF